MAITDLIGTKWQMPQTVNYFTDNTTYLLQGTAESELIETGTPIVVPIEGIMIGTNARYYAVGVGKVSDGALTIPSIGIDRSSREWVYYQRSTSSGSVMAPIVTITGGDDATNPDIIAWLETNATQIVDPTTKDEYIDEIGLAVIRDWVKSKLSNKDVFVVDTANLCSYNELQDAINTPKAILIKHDGNVYPFVEKWETDESNKRYVNIASLQRQGLDKGAMYFFFEATIDDFDSPMIYSSNYVQPTGKPYTDSITGNLSNLATTVKTNLVDAVNEVNGKVGFHVAVGQERWVGTYTDENNVTYQVYSKQIYIPALPATAGITAYEHGIENIRQILDIYGSTVDGFVLNAPRQTVTDNITIYQASKSASNKTFSIEVGKDRSSKKAYVTVVYAKNN